MTVYELMRNTRKTCPFFFAPDTLKSFGERISEMRVLKPLSIVKDVCGEYHTCVVLSKLSRNHPKGPRRTRAYFDTTTWEEVYPQRSVSA